MTWAFENDTSAIIKRISKRDIQSDRLQSILTIISISFTVAIIIVFYLLASSVWQEDFNLHKNDAQIFISADNIPDEHSLETVTSAFAASSNVDWIGEKATIGVFKKDGSIVTVIYQNETQFEHETHDSLLITGNFPSTGNTVMLSQSYLDFLGSTAQVGDTISLDLTGQGIEQEYLLSSIIKNDTSVSNNENRYNVYVSKETASNLLSGEPLLWDTYVHFTSGADSEKSANQSANLILSDISAQNLSVTINPDYPFGGLISVQIHTIKTVIFFVILLFIIDIIIISAIFTISINQRVQYYGQLRTIGMTKKQIRRLISHEGNILAGYGISVGGLLGIIIGFCAHPSGFNIITAIICWICVALITLLIIKLALKKSAKIASAISPIEATKHLPYDPKKMCTFKKKRNLSPLNLALLNLNRNLRKTIVTILSLSICGIAFIIAASFGQSYDAAEGQRFYFYPNGDMQITISNIGNSTFNNDELWSVAITQRLENPLTDELQMDIASIPGVNEVQSSYGIYMNVLRPDGWADSAFQPVITRQQYNALIPALTSDPLSYEELVSSNGILVKDSDYVHPKIGEIYTVTMIDSTGHPTEYRLPVVGSFSQDKVLELSPMTPLPYYLMPTETVTALTGAECNRYNFGIKYEKSKENTVQTALKDIVNNNPNLDFHSLKEQIQDDQNSTLQIVRSAYIFITILFYFSIMNLVNTIETNLRTRQQEFGILQAIGMTRQQMEKMLQLENIFYLFFSSTIALIIGSTAGYFICNFLNQSLHSINYHYPIVLVFTYIIVNIIFQIILSKYIIYRQQKYTIIERISAKN